MNVAKVVQGIALIASLLLAAAAWGASAGRVQLVAGDVQIIAVDGKSRPAVRGDVIDEGDTVVTGAAGALHLRMLDEGVIAVRANTRMRINQFRWSGKEDGNERSALDLVKGGFRTITGVIGRRNKETYSVNTPTATIGIRGTDHEVFHLEAGDAVAASAEAGSYNKVNVGDTFLRTAAGTLELGPNQVGFAPLTALLLQAGGHVRYDPALEQFVPDVANRLCEDRVGFGVRRVEAPLPAVLTVQPRPLQQRLVHAAFGRVALEPKPFLIRVVEDGFD